MSVTGPDPAHPQRVGVPIADLMAGMNGAFGVLAALRERDRTGRGQIVRTSLLASVVAAHAFQGTRWTVAGEVGAAQGNHHPAIAPYGLFRCAGGSVQIACGNDAMWGRLCAAFDLTADDSRYGTNTDRVAHRDDLTALLESAFTRFEPDELLRRLEDRRRARRSGPSAGRGLRVGTDPLATPARRRRAPEPGKDLAPRIGPAHFHRGHSRHGDRDHPCRPRAAAALGADAEAIRGWLDRSPTQA